LVGSVQGNLLLGKTFLAKHRACAPARLNYMPEYGVFFGVGCQSRDICGINRWNTP
jgi:hypothetical protein